MTQPETNRPRTVPRFMTAKRARPVDEPSALVPFGWAPGGYYCAACSVCGDAHTGSAKQSRCCQDCAEKRRDDPAYRLATPPEPERSKVEVMLDELISDAEIARIHDHANFGSMSPRDVVNDGVRKYAVGYEGGSTQIAILLEHGLITKPRPGSYAANLTAKGKRYARVLFHIDKDRLATAERQLDEAVKGLLAAGSIADEGMATGDTVSGLNDVKWKIRATLQSIGAGQALQGNGEGR